MRRVEIRVQTCIDADWSEWFDGFEISYTDQGETILTGSVPDQAALYGLIAKLRDLGLPLLSVNRLEPDVAPAVAGATARALRGSLLFDRLPRTSSGVRGICRTPRLVEAVGPVGACRPAWCF